VLERALQFYLSMRFHLERLAASGRASC